MQCRAVQCRAGGADSGAQCGTSAKQTSRTRCRTRSDTGARQRSAPHHVPLSNIGFGTTATGWECCMQPRRLQDTRSQGTGLHGNKSQNKKLFSDIAMGSFWCDRRGTP